MRDLQQLNRVRDTQTEMRVYGQCGDSGNGVFRLRFVKPGVNVVLLVIASNGDGWDHVSVSCKARVPKWAEMEYVKRLFFCDDETAMQLHVPPCEHISLSHNCLHLWRPQNVEIPRPPAIMVGPS
jgi:hypothetical protein